eukprot:m.315280 g.315280  ORF g.315280 m.315280 type:complete len:229 (+) comp55433_c0_seq6:293-979(+)
MSRANEVTDLCVAVIDDDLEACQRIVGNRGKAIITKRKHGGWATALHCAAGNGHSAILQLFLQHDVDCNILDESGDTALIVSACVGATECVRLLLQHGADPAVRGEHGRSALDCAREEGTGDVVALLEEHDRLLVAQQFIKPALRHPTLTVEHQTEDDLTSECIVLQQIEQPVGVVAEQLDQETDATDSWAETSSREEGSGAVAEEEQRVLVPSMALALTAADWLLLD